MDKKQQCKSCGAENVLEANFCANCGKKLSEVCPKCWLKKEQPYNCGYEKCPGYRLYVIEMLKALKKTYGGK